MIDPFQDVDSFGSEFLDTIVPILENRAAEEQMLPIINSYLNDLNWVEDGTHIEVGAGSGPITRLMAERANRATVIGLDPSEGLIEKAKEASHEHANLNFEVANGDTLRFIDNSIDNVVMHTVLSHVPDPSTLVIEAMRVLKPGGKLVVCDADFEKSSLGSFEGDPLNACADYFVRNYVTHRYLISDIRRIATSAGLKVDDFRVHPRIITDTDGGLASIKMATSMMVGQKLIGAELAEALATEYAQRRAAGTLYGFQPFGTLIASK